MPRTSKSLSLCQRALCVIGAHLQHSTKQLTLHFLLSQSPKIKERGDLSAFSVLLLSMCTAMGMCVAFYIPGDTSNFSKSFMDISFLSFSFETFWLACWFPQPLTAASDSHTVTQLPIIVFNKHPWRLAFLHGASSKSGQIKIALLVESS